MANPVFHSGRNAGLKLNGTAVPISRWMVNPNSEECLFKNSETGPVPVPEGTYLGYPFSFMLDYDFANDPFAVSPGIAPQAQLTTVVFYLHQTTLQSYDGLTLTSTNMYIKTCPLSADVVANRTVGGEVTGLLWGTIVLP